MTRDKILGIFSRDYLIWFHYLLLVGIIFLAHKYSTALEQNVMSNLPYAWGILAAYYYVWIAIGDQLIHWFLSTIVGRQVD